MRHFRNIWFALAAFLWLPVSAHCQLEFIPGLEFFRCVEATPAAHASAGDCDDCCAVENSQYRAESVQLTAPAPNLTPLFLTPELTVDVPAPKGGAGWLTAAPPPWLKTWQFARRTALPVRAPSLAS